MYKNTHFLSVKFIITYSQIYSLSECFAAKEVEKRQNYYQRCRFPGNLCSAGSFREAFYRDFPPQKVRKTIRQWETTSAPQTSCPQGNPSSPRVRTQDVGECRNGRRMYAAMSHRRCFLARLWRCTKALPCHTTAGWAMGSWDGPRSLAGCFRTLLGLCLFPTVKWSYTQEVLLQIWWKLNMILAFLYSSQSLPSNNFVLISLSENICASGRVLRLQSLFLMLSLFGVLCMCFKWDGLEFMDGVLPSVFYSLKISKCIHFIFVS